MQPSVEACVMRVLRARRAGNAEQRQPSLEDSAERIMVPSVEWHADWLLVNRSTADVDLFGLRRRNHRCRR